MTFDELVDAYYEQARGLMDGGVDLLLVETIFDTLNAKAAFFAIAKLSTSGNRVPVMARSRFIHRQQPRRHRADRRSILEFHFPRAAAERRHQLRARPESRCGRMIEELARIAPVYMSCHPNAGLPNPLCRPVFAETPGDARRRSCANWAANGWLNIVGGCCGTTPGTHQSDRRSGPGHEAPRTSAA